MNKIPTDTYPWLVNKWLIRRDQHHSPLYGKVGSETCRKVRRPILGDYYPRHLTEWEPVNEKD